FRLVLSARLARLARAGRPGPGRGLGLVDQVGLVPVGDAQVDLAAAVLRQGQGDVIVLPRAGSPGGVWGRGGALGGLGHAGRRRTRARWPVKRAKSAGRRRGRFTPGELTSRLKALGRTSWTSRRAETSRETLAQSSWEM